MYIDVLNTRLYLFTGILPVPCICVTSGEFLLYLLASVFAGRIET